MRFEKASLPTLVLSPLVLVLVLGFLSRGGHAKREVATAVRAQTATIAEQHRELVEKGGAQRQATSVVDGADFQLLVSALCRRVQSSLLPAAAPAPDRCSLAELVAAFGLERVAVETEIAHNSVRQDVHAWVSSLGELSSEDTSAMREIVLTSLRDKEVVFAVLVATEICSRLPGATPTGFLREVAINPPDQFQLARFSALDALGTAASAADRPFLLDLVHAHDRRDSRRAVRALAAMSSASFSTMIVADPSVISGAASSTISDIILREKEDFARPEVLESLLLHHEQRVVLGAVRGLGHLPRDELPPEIIARLRQLQEVSESPEVRSDVRELLSSIEADIVAGQ